MSRKSSIIVLSVTVVLTLFFAAVAVFFNPYSTGTLFSEEVRNEAENRQGQSLVSVSEPLDTDLESRQNDDKLASRVAAKLTEDDSFMTEVGDRSVSYVDSKMGDIETKYAESTDRKIREEADSIRGSMKSTEEIAAELLESESFVSALESALKEKIGNEYDTAAVADAILSSESFRNAVSELLKENESSVPLPVFSSTPDASLSESEYMEKRSAERSDEISRVLAFLGY